MACQGWPCRARDAKGCTNAGILHRLGKGAPADAEHAAAFLEAGCPGGEAGACATLGVQYERGEGVAKDEARALALYLQACNVESAFGCLRLAAAHENGVGGPADLAAAARFYGEACRHGDGQGCFHAGRLAEAGGEVDRARELYRRACEREESDWAAPRPTRCRRRRLDESSARLSRRLWGWRWSPRGSRAAFNPLSSWSQENAGY